MGSAGRHEHGGDRLRIAVVGSGIAGLTVAHRLHPHHDITLFESRDRIGGHTHTVRVTRGGRQFDVDTGFIVCNDLNYPNFLALLEEIGATTRKSEMSFAVRDERSGLEYCGSSWNGIFAQRRNLVRPRFLKMLLDIARFNREGTAWRRDHADEPDADAQMTISDFVRDRGYGAAFRDHYLSPMGGAIWSCGHATFLEFPLRFVLDFMANHRMLQVEGRPTWRTVVGGSSAYVTRLTKPFRDRIRLATPVRRIMRGADGVRLETETSAPEHFDEVVVATHADQALRLLGDPGPVETEVLSAFPYRMNDVLLHDDVRVLPRRRSVWSSWNAWVPLTQDSNIRVTYNMNILQGLQSDPPFLVSLNDDDRVNPSRILRRLKYAHPMFGPTRDRMQMRHPELIRANRTSYCGAYWGYGFHEDGVVSGIRVAEAFGGGAAELPRRIADARAIA